MTNKWDMATATTAVGCAVVSGVFFAFSGFVMRGLTRLPDSTGVQAMQSINITAVRFPLMAALFGSGLACAVLAVRASRNWGDPQSRLVIAGCALYWIGAIGLTAVYNVPLNDQLSKLSTIDPATPAKWHSYARDWNLANHVRTLAAASSSLLLILSLVTRAADRGSVSAATGASIASKLMHQTGG